MSDDQLHEQILARAQRELDKKQMKTDSAEENMKKALKKLKKESREELKRLTMETIRRGESGLVGPDGISTIQAAQRVLGSGGREGQVNMPDELVTGMEPRYWEEDDDY